MREPHCPHNPQQSHLKNQINFDDECTMRKQFDFSNAGKNPYAKQLNKVITAVDLETLSADIRQGLADVKSNRVSTLDAEAIKHQGRQCLKFSAK